jgi:Flp pilus assembly protein TadD
MTRNAYRNRLIGLTLVAALGSTALTGCTTARQPKARLSASQAEAAIQKGDDGKSVGLAERAVMTDPNNAEFRATLGAAYLKTGRFQSAATAYDDAMALGDSSARTALSLALAQIGAGRADQALAVLDGARDTIAPADLGLAYALAGEPQRGVAVLTDTLRSGENTPKVRQNLAYAFALSGDWRQARIMASMDVPAEQLGDRMAQWASTIQPDAFQQRVASLLSVPVRDKDPGQPAALALNGAPARQFAAANVARPVNAELPPLAKTAAAPQSVKADAALTRYEAPTKGEPSSFEAAFVQAPRGITPATLIADTIRFVSEPVVQQLPATYAAQAAKPRLAAVSKPAMAPATLRTGDHLVQLGSFVSEEGARQAWGVYAKRNPALGRYRMQISKAVVNGKSYWRVAAAGFSRSDAQTLCAGIKARGQGCIPYAKGNPLPGTVA